VPHRAAGLRHSVHIALRRRAALDTSHTAQDHLTDERRVLLLSAPLPGAPTAGGSAS
jgi:hypothetical protein